MRNIRKERTRIQFERTSKTSLIPLVWTLLNSDSCLILRSNYNYLNVTVKYVEDNNDKNIRAYYERLRGLSELNIKTILIKGRQQKIGSYFKPINVSIVDDEVVFRLSCFNSVLHKLFCIFRRSKAVLHYTQ